LQKNVASEKADNFEKGNKIRLEQITAQNLQFY